MIPVSHGKPCAGNPHARFDEGVSASETPRRNALLHNTLDNQVSLPFAHYSAGRFFVSFPHGVDFSFPIAGNWRIEQATQGQLENIEVDEDGLHWPDLDEDLSFEGLLHGDYGQFVRRPAITCL